MFWSAKRIWRSLFSVFLIKQAKQKVKQKHFSRRVHAAKVLQKWFSYYNYQSCVTLHFKASLAKSIEDHER